MSCAVHLYVSVIALGHASGQDFAFLRGGGEAGGSGWPASAIWLIVLTGIASALAAAGVVYLRRRGRNTHLPVESIVREWIR